ncbi:Arm DNA-binding domain-containing protein [Variovorax sp. LjRoot84]|uniref:Arm DNA-binding domain-containing protein n=1 Tax=Variovorax sp. LjRoot84 TaxID=3342340 RepID=UPI003F50FE84
MALGDTFVRQVKHTGKPSGDKYSDGGGMYLLVSAAGKYWRMDYRLDGKRRTLVWARASGRQAARGVTECASAEGATQLMWPAPLC